MYWRLNHPAEFNCCKKYGYRVLEVIPSHAEELDASHLNVAEVVVKNAALKGMEVVSRLRAQGKTFEENTVLVAADTLVVMGEKIYPKPKHMEEAEEFLLELGGRSHFVLTGVFLYHLQAGRQRQFFDRTAVTMTSMSVPEIHQLFQQVTPLDKAGGYGFQASPHIVEKLEGSRTNVIGLPMEALRSHLMDLVGTDPQSNPTPVKSLGRKFTNPSVSIFEEPHEFLSRGYPSEANFKNKSCFAVFILVNLNH